MNPVQQRLEDFAGAVLQRHGALVEWSGAEGMALLPPPLARQLGCPEAVRLTHEAVHGEASALSLNLATDFLDRMEKLVAGERRETRVRIEQLYLKKAAMDEPVARMFAFPNARVRVVGAAAQRIEYHCWTFQAVLESEERWEDLLALTINAASGAVVGLPDPLSLTEAVEDSAGMGEWPPDLGRARRRAAEAAQRRAAPFVARLESRLERDRRRLREYYHALVQEDLGGRPGDVDPAKHAEKCRVVELEQRRKLLELDERYALRTSLEPLVLVRLDMPVLRVECAVQRRQARGVCGIYWNPLRKELEPLACTRCGQDITVVCFDETPAPFCPRCLP